MTADLHSLSFPGALLARGFWLYVWEIVTSDGTHLFYVGRTGDEASAHAQSPFSRVSQHLGSNKNANALRRILLRREISISDCSFEMVAFGPIFPEAGTWEKHKPHRDQLAGLEKALRDALADAGYDVLNEIRCKRELNVELWGEIRAVFSARFPKLNGKALAATTENISR
jgi:hypothetical protein